MSKALLSNLQSIKVSPSRILPVQISLPELMKLIPENYKPRTKLPHFRDADLKLNVAKFLKDAVGKDLTRITMPVVFSEPLSLLQRLAEEYGAYSELLDKAVKSTQSTLRLAYVAAFAQSCYGSTPDRLYKPFNPILGETYELINREKNYWLLSEQVSHHPPISACICEGDGWTITGHAEVKTKFWGRSLEIYPVGAQTLTIHPYKDVYVWNKAVTTINNVIVGTKWIEHYGEMIVVNRTTGDKCKLNLEKTSNWFGSSSTAKVTGCVYDHNNNPCYHITGTWTDQLEAIPFTSMGELNESERFTIWKCAPWPENLKEQYNYTQFAVAENEFPSFLEPVLPITDSRWRPDQRAFELGQIEFSQEEKSRLENLQRDMRKKREESGEEWQPRWFEAIEADGHLAYHYKGGYWEARISQKWGELPNIFGLDLDKIKKNAAKSET
eukprot:TRINITY_DN6018_c0_g1_i1.p1 TRINITY_DN6018_c0_g1~~TRINITY_DN6018_c0_g1_i1.p1  ORF type:complete len:457 (-),score=52.38 TRINITY_DN6018_c0_g1_i1:115-1437(-)